MWKTPQWPRTAKGQGRRARARGVPQIVLACSPKHHSHKVRTEKSAVWMRSLSAKAHVSIVSLAAELATPETSNASVSGDLRVRGIFTSEGLEDWRRGAVCVHASDSKGGKGKGRRYSRIPNYVSSLPKSNAKAVSINSNWPPIQSQFDSNSTWHFAAKPTKRDGFEFEFALVTCPLRLTIILREQREHVFRRRHAEHPWTHPSPCFW